MKTQIPVSLPLIGKQEVENVLAALKEKAISGLYGRYINEFEDAFSRYSGCAHGVAVNSGTTALHLALVALNIGKGDEVLVSTFTNMATFFAVIYQGAHPVPIDIEPDTWNMDPNILEGKITKKTKAILLVHIYGHPCDMDPIIKIAKKHNLYIIEDCAEAHGAVYKGKKVGSFGDVGCFSFYANKIITTGEGGMLTTNNKKMASRLASLKSLAFGEKNRFMHQDIGFGYRMTNLAAAIGLAQLKRIDLVIDLKRKIAQYYNDRFFSIKGLQLPVEKGYALNVYWMYHVVLNKQFGFSRDVLRKKLELLGIQTREAFVPYNMQRIFIRRGWVKFNECPRANYVAKNGFYLPSGPDLNQKQLEYVVSSLSDIQKKS